MDTNGWVLLVLAVVLGVALYLLRNLRRYRGAWYTVMRSPDEAKVLEVLHTMRGYAHRLAHRLEASARTDDERAAARRLRSRVGVLSERAFPIGGTVHKGWRIYLCVRDSRGLAPLASTTLVFLHELAHVMSTSVGHTAEFERHMQRLLDAAETEGIYTRRSSTLAVSHCGAEVVLTR